METKYTKVLLIFFIVFYLSCSSQQSGGERMVSSNENTLELPDTEIYKFFYKHTNKEKVVWDLVSDKAEVFNKDALIKITGVNLNFYKNNRIDSKVTSKFGEIKNQRLLTAITNVVLTTSDGRLLFTDILYWDNMKALLYTDDFVKITNIRNGECTKAKGMEADNNLEKIVLKKTVRGKFYDTK